MRTRLSLSVRGKRLLRELRRLRDERQMSPEDVAGQLGWHKTKLYRIERGESRLILDDLDELLELYGVRSPERESLFKLGKDAWKRGWWLAYRDLYQGESFFVMENDAAKISVFAPNLLPGLLQTEEYAREVIAALDPQGQDAEVERQVAVRIERQGILARPEPPKLIAFLDEGVLRRAVSDPRVQRDQLSRLVELARRPTVNLRVVPFGSGIYMAQSGQFTIFEFPDPEDTPVVYQEGLFGDVYVEDPADVARYRLAASKTAGVALDTDESITLIRGLLKETE
ncbi:DUF5753 domain-containing protein [Nocardiopsis sp. NRRL B-16309]|uniref:DUF5753 domain-containing protein n=1 Tax=Nocardiopsis sp. NRRL B-16309 TaxID=1519494 RepID=UPI0006ADF496|nr:DUF5753 domain-containing protein [Nocardiopsis sp. NRRL B-16309]KOX24241.1 hypothetical protein ADL05_01470 [Nocardiopsis sp. NRRL B-16309]